MQKCDIFLIFAQNIDCGYTLVLTSTHNLWFREKNRKKYVYPCKPQFYYIKVGCKGRVATRQGKVREIEIFSRSGNCQGI